MKTMKKIFALSVFLFLCAGTVTSFAQNIGTEPGEIGGEYPVKRNNAANPCISSQQYAAMEKRISENIKLLKLDKAEHKTTSTLFSWPLQMTGGLNDCSYYFIANYVDEDPTSGLLDYNCGMVTYDGHRGTDIGTMPYPFYKMDNNQVAVIAAAPGTIIDKQDGHFDKNCAMNTDTANDIFIQHADGSVALYYHMKKFSLTPKIVGNTVTAGEFLGIAGSSGSSTGPHLHFEVWGTTLSSSLKDPWAGTCNSLGATTWWTTQKPYTEPAVVKNQVNSIPVILPGCDTTETPNDDTCFAPGATAKFYLFIRNETVGDTAYERIVNPGGTTFTSWIHKSITSYLGSYWIMTKTLSTTPGLYTYETIYNGINCSTRFRINCATLGVTTITDLAQIEVSPNPASNTLTIAGEGIDNGNYRFTLRNIIGQTMLDGNAKIENNALQKNLQISAIPNGIYFLEIASDKSRTVRKIIKQD